MQTEGISVSLEDKLAIARCLDELGVDYVEGGYPASGPKDTQFFAETAKLGLANCKIVAFGSTRRIDSKAEDDASLNAILACKAPAAPRADSTKLAIRNNVIRQSVWNLVKTSGVAQM